MKGRQKRIKFIYLRGKVEVNMKTTVGIMTHEKEAKHEDVSEY